MNMNNLRERYFSGRAYIGISPAIFLSASVWFTADEFAINLGYSFHLYLCCLLFFVSGFLCSKANSKDPLFSSRASYTFAFGLSVLSISSILLIIFLNPAYGLALLFIGLMVLLFSNFSHLLIQEVPSWFKQLIRKINIMLCICMIVMLAYWLNPYTKPLLSIIK